MLLIIFNLKIKMYKYLVKKITSIIKKKLLLKNFRYSSKTI